MSNKVASKTEQEVGVIFNSQAKGGMIKKIWSEILDSNILYSSFNLAIKEQIDISNLENDYENKLIIWVNNCIRKGIKNFIAAGGDGTVHIAVNALYKFRLYSPILGAIGLGSSNDFHKPFKHTIKNIPIRLNFTAAIAHDLGEVVYVNNKDELKTEYLIINASVGFTAEANAIFNEKNKFISFLKKRFTNLAIFFSIGKELFKFKPLITKITFNGTTKRNFKVINIGVIKNPHFAGDLKYENKINSDSGFFNIYILKTDSTRKIKLILSIIKILKDFLSENILSNRLLSKNLCQEIEIKTTHSAILEIDGELKKFKHAKFKILPKGLLLCP